MSSSIQKAIKGFALTPESYAERAQLAALIQADIAKAEGGERVDLNQTAAKLRILMEALNKDSIAIGKAELTRTLYRAHQAHKNDLEGLTARVNALFSKAKGIPLWVTPFFYTALTAGAFAVALGFKFGNFFSALTRGTQMQQLQQPQQPQQRLEPLVGSGDQEGPCWGNTSSFIDNQGLIGSPPSTSIDTPTSVPTKMTAQPVDEIDLAKGKAAETRKGPVDLRSAEQTSAANCLGSEDEKSESKPLPPGSPKTHHFWGGASHQNRFFNHERYRLAKWNFTSLGKSYVDQTSLTDALNDEVDTVSEHAALQFGSSAVSFIEQQSSEFGRFIGRSLGNNPIGNVVEQNPKTFLAVFGGLGGLFDRIATVWRSAKCVGGLSKPAPPDQWLAAYGAMFRLSFATFDGLLTTVKVIAGGATIWAVVLPVIIVGLAKNIPK